MSVFRPPFRNQIATVPPRMRVAILSRPIFNYELPLTENATMSEVITHNVGKFMSDETASIIDLIAHNVGLVQLETLANTEDVAKNVGLVMSESMANTEVFTKTFGLVKSETLGITDSMTFLPIFLRVPKGSKLPHSEVDTNLNYLNSVKLEIAQQSTVVANAITPQSGFAQINVSGVSDTLVIENPLPGTSLEGDSIILRIKDNGTARLIQWGTDFRGIVDNLPNSTVASKLLYIGLAYNHYHKTWDMIAIAQEA